MQPVKYRLADGTEIELRVPTLHKDDRDLSKLLNRVGNYDIVLRDLVKRATTAETQEQREKAIDAVTETQDGQNEAFRKFLRLALSTKLGTDDIESKVIAQCTEEDQRNILQACREGNDYYQRLMMVLPFGASDVSALAKLVFKTPESLANFAQSLNPPPTSSGEPTGTSTTGS